MCPTLTKEELVECMEDPSFCVVCGCNRDVPVNEDHVCLECMENIYPDKPINTCVY